MGALITPEELLDRSGPVTLLDVRWQLGRDDGLEQHHEGHIPGAAYVDLPRDLADPHVMGRGRHPLPEPAAFTEAMRRVGVCNGRPVVVYDDVGGTAAARAWWLLRHYGHPDVRVLDGGWSAWLASGGPVESGPVESGPVQPDRGDFDGQPGHLPVVDAAGAAAVARDGVLLDARAPERFRGETEPVDPVAGHVPGAVNVPTAANLERCGPRAGRFRPPEELAEVYAVGGRSGEVAVYCGSGVTATHNVLALELLGVRAALYPGSWSEWVTDPRRPVATGEEPRG